MNRAILVVFVVGLASCIGCDIGNMAGTGNRVEKLNDATRETIAVLKVINNEETAKANQSKLEELAESIKVIREGIEQATAQPDSGGAAVMNHRPWQMQIQMETNIRRQLERIHEDPKAGEIVDKALEGSGFVYVPDRLE